MKKKLISVLLLPLVVASLASCQNSKSESNQTETGNSQTSETTPVKVVNKDILNALQIGVKLTGQIKTTSKFFEDAEYIVPSDKAKTSVEVRNLVQTYTNSNDYTGVDYKIRRVNSDDTTTYIASENMYDNDGHLFFNSVDYDNVLSPDYYAQDEFGNYVPYGSNASLNPFTLLSVEDFIYVKDSTFTLNKVKSELVFNNLAFFFQDININTNIDKALFTFSDTALTNIDIVTKDFKEITTIDLVNVYKASQHELSLQVSEIGTANAKDEIKVEKQKDENNDLGVALANFAKAKSYRVNRHYKTPLAPEEETIDLYFNNQNEAIYMAAYDSHVTHRPAMPTNADALLKDSPKDEDDDLDAYMYMPLPSDSSKFAFQHTGLLKSIDNLLPYEAFVLPLDGISQNVFNKNDDGSFSPIDANLAYMAGDCFVPFLCSTNEIAGGHVEGFKLYLNEEKDLIDHIVLNTRLADITAEITITYDLVNECEIPFNALNKIYE